MEIPKPSEADKASFRSLVADDARVEVKPMFGNLGAFVNGNMFMGLFGAGLGVKLGPDDAKALSAIAGTGPFGPPERPMSGYVSLPAAWREDPQTAHWVARALDYVSALPEKSAKKR
jgi:TfoX/Sxy family transcriptional regulator of competence genes